MAPPSPGTARSRDRWICRERPRVVGAHGPDQQPLSGKPREPGGGTRRRNPSPRHRWSIVVNLRSPHSNQVIQIDCDRTPTLSAARRPVPERRRHCRRDECRYGVAGVDRGPVFGVEVRARGGWARRKHGGRTDRRIMRGQQALAPEPAVVTRHRAAGMGVVTRRGARASRTRHHRRLLRPRGRRSGRPRQGPL